MHNNVINNKLASNYNNKKYKDEIINIPRDMINNAFKNKFENINDEINKINSLRINSIITKANSEIICDYSTHSEKIIIFNDYLDIKDLDLFNISDSKKIKYNDNERLLRPSINVMFYDNFSFLHKLSKYTDDVKNTVIHSNVKLINTMNSYRITNYSKCIIKIDNNYEFIKLNIKIDVNNMSIKAMINTVFNCQRITKYIKFNAKNTSNKRSDILNYCAHWQDSFMCA
ncbi:MAG: hypothetical protein KGQ42_02090 [Alphaproteobacteria bacterium]|nr:hypothetical protein [Alphaproteobacteria bacterium]